MAALYLKELRKAQPYGPYFLCGYCGGGTIAYEAAQQLHAIGERVALLAMFDTMNWSKIPITLWSKTAYAVQRLIFHGATFLSLGWKDKSKFLHEKAEVLRGRLPVWRGYLQSKFKKTSGDAQSISVALARIWQINDAACWEYLPKPFAGRVTDFRPSKQYRIFDKPELKWDALAQGGQDVVVLPVYPASMLIEPFVENLAAALEKSIDRAISAEDTRAFAAPQEKRGDAW
jgi:thioesterase domain-containing protein